MIIDLFIAYSFKSKTGNGVGNCIIGVTSTPKSYEDISKLQNVILAKNEGCTDIVITNWIVMEEVK